MAIVSVNIDSTDYEILPGTLRFRAEPVVVTLPNEPCVVTGFKWVVEFEMDVDDIGSLVSTLTGGTGSTVTVVGFPVVYTAMIDIGYTGQGIQKVPVRATGTGTV